MIISPSVSVSRLRSISPSSSPSGSAFAPTMEVSSSAVMSAFRGSCLRVLSSMIAIMAATPIPSSAPRVVLLAYTQSPSMCVSIGSVSKLCADAGDFCGTMSMCACRMIPLRFSMPGDAGFFMTMFPAGSWNASTPVFLCEVKEELPDFVKVSGRTWNLCEQVKIAPDAFRLKVLNLVHSICFLEFVNDNATQLYIPKATTSSV